MHVAQLCTHVLVWSRELIVLLFISADTPSPLNLALREERPRIEIVSPLTVITMVCLQGDGIRLPIYLPQLLALGTPSVPCATTERASFP